MARKKKTEAVLEAVAETAQMVSRKILKLDSGSEYEVISSDGKFYDCGKSKFRKSNPHIVSVIEREETIEPTAKVEEKQEQEAESDGDDEH